MRLLVVLLATSAVAAAADNPETAVERSHERAKRVLEAAIDAIGGRASIEGIKAVRLTLGGESVPRLQNASAEPPYVPGSYHEETVIDLERNRLSVVQKTTGAGFRGNTRIVVNGGKGQVFDLLNRTVTTTDSGVAQQQQFVQYQRRLPALVLRTALQREATLRFVGDDVVNGAPHQVITFVHVDGIQMALYVDEKTKLPVYSLYGETR